MKKIIISILFLSSTLAFAQTATTETGISCMAYCQNAANHTNTKDVKVLLDGTASKDFYCGDNFYTLFAKSYGTENKMVEVHINKHLTSDSYERAVGLWFSLSTISGKAMVASNNGKAGEGVVCFMTDQLSNMLEMFNTKIK